jgi:Protein of unknown function (DUF3405)
MRPLDRTVDGWRDRLLSHHASGQVVREYKNIRSATAGLGSTIFLYHHISNNAPPALPTRNLYLFSDESLSKLNYRMIGPTLVPGHVGFPVLQFFCDNPDFDYYWAIEYDVRFSGDWFFFFDSFKEANHDFWRATSVITPTNRIGHGGL